MGQRKYSNRATSTLASGITNVATSLTLSAGDGTKFPVLAAGEFFSAVIQKGALDTDVREYVRVTARAGDTLTIVRAQGGSTGQAFAAGDVLAAVVLSEDLDGFLQRGGDSMFGPISMGGNKVVGLADASDAGDAVHLGQLPWERLYDVAVTAVASVQFTWDVTKYRSVHLLVDGVKPAGGGTTDTILARVLQNGSLLTGATDYFRHQLNLLGTTPSYNSGSVDALALSTAGNSASAEGFHMDAQLFLGAAGQKGGIVGISRGVGGTGERLLSLLGGQVPVITAAINGIRFYWSTGVNFQAVGRIQILGLRA